MIDAFSSISVQILRAVFSLKYVDDTTVYEIVEKKGTSHAQSILDVVSAWSTNNKFQLHPSKYNELRIKFSDKSWTCRNR